MKVYVEDFTLLQIKSKIGSHHLVFQWGGQDNHSGAVYFYFLKSAHNSVQFILFLVCLFLVFPTHINFRHAQSNMPEEDASHQKSRISCRNFNNETRGTLPGAPPFYPVQLVV